MMNDKWMLPQELLAQNLLIESTYGVIHNNKILDLMKRYNLKFKKGKSIDDIHLAIGRGLKGAIGNFSLAEKQIAEEIDKVCIIARWDFAVAKYK